MTVDKADLPGIGRTGLIKLDNYHIPSDFGHLRDIANSCNDSISSVHIGFDEG
jgi:hypothetical protein